MSKQKKGFTLVELLVVIAIIALLLSIVLPALGKVKRQGKLVVCGSNQRQIATSLVTYTVHDSNGKYPERTVKVFTHVASNPTDIENIGSIFLSYLSESPMLFWCPLKNTIGAGQYPVKPGMHSSVTPSNKDREIWSKYFWLGPQSYGGDPTCYVMSYNLFAGVQPPTTGLFDWSTSGNADRTRSPHLSGSSKDVILSDEQTSFGGRFGVSTVTSETSNHSVGYLAVAGGGVGLSGFFKDTNVAYSDGHVEKHTVLERGVLRVPTATWYEY